MPIVVALPPNFETIKIALPLANRTHLYSYGGTLYNPSGRQTTIDQEYHEFIHSEQQIAYGDCDRWWYSYLTDRRFRLQQEIEAYGKQYRFCKEKIRASNSFFTWLKENMAHELCGDVYGNLVSYSEAESLIRKYGKKEN